MKRSPFKTLAKAHSSRPTSPNEAPLAIDEDSLRKRREARKVVNFAATELSGICAAGTKKFPFAFEHRVRPGELLVHQLVHGAMLLLKGKDLSYTTIQDTFYGLDEFFDFCDQRRESSTPVRFIADINVHIAKELEAWYLQNYPGRSVNRKRFGRIRAIVNRLKHDFGELPEVGPTFPWPSGPANNDTPTESYRIETFNALSEAALRDIKFVIQEMRRFSELIGSCPIIRFPELSLADVFLEIGIEEDERRIEQGVDQFWSQATQRIRKKEIVRVAAKRYGMFENEIVALYFSQGAELSRSGVRFPSYKVTEKRTLQGMSVAESADIAMCTFASEFPSWPLEMPHAEASRLISFESFKNPREKPRAHITAYKVLQTLRFGYQPESMDWGLMAYIARRNFTSATLYPFFLFVQINTGWNEEVVLSITEDLEAHIEPDIVDPDYVLIWGWKGKVDSAMTHRSSRTAPYGVYNILQFISSIIKSYGHASDSENSLWQFVIEKNLWPKYEKVISSLNSGSLGSASSSFLLRHQIVVDPDQKIQRIDARRMRTTCETRRRETGLGIDEVCTLMGHANIDTTDASYDSDAGSVELKNQRLRGLQQKMVEDVLSYEARLVTCSTLQALREAVARCGGASNPEGIASATASLGLRESEVVHLLSPRGQTYIAVCIDRQNPTWPRASEFVAPGASCNYFNRCCMCNKGRIFKEALPFIARRVIDLERLRKTIPALEWLNNYGEECAAWEGILEDWNDRDQVKEAKRLSWLNEYALPMTMRGA